MSDFVSELTSLLNRHSRENGSGTPDFILAEYLWGCLTHFNSRVVDDALAESKPHAKSPTPAVELNESGVDFDACAHCGHDDRAHWVGADDNGTGGVCGVIRCGCSLFADGPPRHPGPLRNPKQVAWFEYVIKR